MEITAFLQRCDSKTIRVLAGDLGQGYWEFDGRSLSRTTNGKRDEVLLEGHMKSLDVHRQLEKDQYEPIVGAGLGALIGLGLGGPVGAAVGGVVGHCMINNSTEISVTIELDDGRSFMAVMVPQLMYRFKQMVPK